MSEGNTWAVVNTHARKVGKVRAVRPKDHAPVIAVDTHGGAEMAVYSPDHRMIAELEHATDTPGGHATLFLSPAQAWEMVAALERVLAELGVAPDEVAANTRAVA